jgi:hypothetical protein
MIYLMSKDKLMDSQERDDLKTFLQGLYGSQVHASNMTDEVFNIAFKMVKESSGCSDAMDLVPRPFPAGASPIRWLKGQARKAFLRQLKNRKEYYASCLNYIKLHYRTHITMAARGA